VGDERHNVSIEKLNAVITKRKTGWWGLTHLIKKMFSPFGKGGDSYAEERW